MRSRSWEGTATDAWHPAAIGRAELYSVGRDPLETHDLSSASSTVVGALTDGERARLRNLGYID